MATRERYRNEIWYLYKQPPHINGEKPQWSGEGIMFRCNDLGNVRDYHQNQMDVIQNKNSKTLRTDTQIEFKVGDRVANTNIPMNIATKKDYSLIVKINETPFNENGNRYRTTKRTRKDLIVS